MFSVCPHLGEGGNHSAGGEGGQSADSARKGGQPAGGGVSWGGGQPAGESASGGGAASRGGQPGGGSAKIGQQNEYSLHGGRYASCVHAGGLSCCLFFLFAHDPPHCSPLKLTIYNRVFHKLSTTQECQHCSLRFGSITKNQPV